MVSIMKSLNAFDELIKEVSTYKITFAADASVNRLKDAAEELRTLFNENPGDRIALQHKYNKANTYALQVEYFLCMYNSDCNKRYKERENAKALYELARQLLYRYSDKEKDSRDYFLLIEYVGIAQRYYIASEDFIIEQDDNAKKKVEEMSKYLIGVAKEMGDIPLEEYSVVEADIRKNEETESVVTINSSESEDGDEDSGNESTGFIPADIISGEQDEHDELVQLEQSEETVQEQIEQVQEPEVSVPVRRVLSEEEL